MKQRIRIYIFSCASCGACETEILLASLFLDSGVSFEITEDIKETDLFIICGVITPASAARLKQLAGIAPAPVVITSIGACADNGGVFSDSFNREGPASRTVKTKYSLPGCPPPPDEIVKMIEKTVNERENT